MKYKALGIDLGNGFIKIVSQDKTLVEQAVFSYMPKADYSLKEVVSYNINGSNILLGQQAIDSKLELLSAVGNVDAISRYNSIDYFNLMYAFIYKFANTTEDITIDNLVIGLPNNHFKQCSVELKKMFENKKVIINDTVIHIKKVEVLPQPLGTYLVEELPGKEVLLIDLGQGTVDYTKVSPDGIIVDMFSTEDGVKKLHLDLLKYLADLDASSDLKLEDIPKIIQNGFSSLKGLKKEINELTVNELKTENAKRLLSPAIQRYNYLNNFDEIIIFGGGAEVYKEQIKDLSKELDNIRVVEDDAQLSNAKGFFIFANNLADQSVTLVENE